MTRDDGMLSAKEVALALGLSAETLRQWRRNGGGPRFFTFGRAVRYRTEDVDAWVAARGMRRRRRAHSQPRG